MITKLKPVKVIFEFKLAADYAIAHPGTYQVWSEAFISGRSFALGRKPLTPLTGERI